MQIFFFLIQTFNYLYINLKQCLDTGCAYEENVGNIIEFMNGVRYYSGWADKLTGSTYPTLTNLHIISRRGNIN